MDLPFFLRQLLMESSTEKRNEIWSRKWIISSVLSHRRQLLVSLPIRPLNFLFDVYIVWLNKISESQILLRIFVTTEDFGIVWQNSQFIYQRIMHLLGGAFKKSATSANEQCVAGEYDPIVACVNVIAYMSARMTWCEQTFHRQVANF